MGSYFRNCSLNGLRQGTNLVIAAAGAGGYVYAQNQPFIQGVSIGLLTYSVGKLVTGSAEFCFKAYKGIRDQNEDSWQRSFKTTMLKISAIYAIGVLPVALFTKYVVDNELSYKDIICAQLLGSYLPSVALTLVTEGVKRCCLALPTQAEDIDSQISIATVNPQVIRRDQSSTVHTEIDIEVKESDFINR